jgi:alpha-tubulin suppressor-like RCC1 family protein
MKTPRRRIVRSAALGVLASFVACSHDARTIVDPIADTTTTNSDVATVSDAVHSAAAASSVMSVGASAAAALIDVSDVVYVSLPPGTLPNGELAKIQNARTGASALVHLTDGGFDPVPMAGRAGDALQVDVTGHAGVSLYRAGISVPVRKPPRVVRTSPPKGKTDSPLNTRVVVVFSEPVDASTVTPASIQLLRGSTAVAGAVKFLDPSLDASHVSVEFVPNAPLTAGAEYKLVVTTQVHDLSGDALPAEVTVTFGVGESLVGPPASIRVVPDSMLELVVGDRYQLSAVVLDAAGNMLTDQPVTWAAGSGFGYADPCALTLSSTGLLTTISEEGCRVTASIGEVSKGLTVIVRTRPASVTLSPTPTSVAAGDYILLTATVRDAAGNVIKFPLTWTSSDPAVATVLDYGDADGVAGGMVTGVSPGNVKITATTNGAAGSASGMANVAVGPARPVASVRLSTPSTSLVIQGKIQFSASLFDANGRVIYNRPVAWQSSNINVATVDTTGLVTGVRLGSVNVSASSGGVSSTEAIEVTTVTFASVSTGFAYSCGVTPTSAAWCWGGKAPGVELGELGSGSPYGTLVPTMVTGGLSFTQISAGWLHTCGLTTNQAAYCWGRNEYGVLGDGSSLYDPSFIPVAVRGGLSFAALSVGSFHNCGVTTSNAAYCWGKNDVGELGLGTTGPESCYTGGANVPCSTIPLAVAGGLAFSMVSAGGELSCGVTTTGVGYCWGQGALGDGSFHSSLVPVPVSGGLTFVAISAGPYGTSCGLTTSGAAYCWGYGPLGDGTSNSSLVPVPVLGGLTFVTLSTGDGTSCGITGGGDAYCWGGAIGNGSSAGSLVPVLVSAELKFTSISVGRAYTGDGPPAFACGVTTDGTTFCWGSNAAGELGNGTTTSSRVPVKIAGQP